MIDPLSPQGLGLALEPNPPASSDKFSYAVPHDLLTKLVDALKEKGFDPTELDEEFAFTASLQKTYRTVGIRRFFGAQDDWPIDYDYLPRESPSNRPRNQKLGGVNIDVYAAAFPNADIKRFEYDLARAKARSKRIWEVAQGYAGWLMATPDFVDEHDRLVSDFRAEIESWGPPSLSRPVTAGAIPPGYEPASSRQNEYYDVCDKFCVKWRLSSLAGPGLPVPLTPELPASPTILSLGRQNDVGKLFYFPDTFPIPGAEDIRELLEESVRGGSTRPSHLAEWSAMISNRTFAKNELKRFGRLFEVQHYCRLLHQRRPRMLYRRQGKLERALAEFLECSQSALHVDVMQLTKRLGEGWMTRGTCLEATVDGSFPSPKPPVIRKPR